MLFFVAFNTFSQQSGRVRDFGIEIGVMNTGELNAVTDVEGLKVGQVTLIEGEDVRTGVTAILPHTGNIFREKVPAAIHIANGFGKLTGISQVKELGNIETPVILTNTLSVPKAADALLTYTLGLEGNENVRSVNPVVGETNDGTLNDIRGRHVKEEHVLEAIEKAEGGPVAEGNVGAGTGTRSFGFKSGIGTSSRVLPEDLGGYTVGVIVQTNYGGVLEVNGVPIGQELETYSYRQHIEDADGSCMIVVATDAPLCSRNLERLAKRAVLGLGKTGGIISHGSGDYVIAMSTAEENLITGSGYYDSKVIQGGGMSPLFMAVNEATEEAILNSLFMAETMKGRDGNKIEALPLDEVIEIMKQYNKIK